MAKKYFPVNYKPLYSIAETRSYIAAYLKKLFIKVENNRNAIYVDPPLATSYRYNWNAFMPGERLITFDHKWSYELNQIYSDIDNYMHHTLIHAAQSKDVSIYTYLPVINRDGSRINESMINYNLCMEMYAPHSAPSRDLIKQAVANLFEALKSLAIEQATSKKYTPSYSHEKITFITIEKLIKTFPRITLSEAIDRFTCHNGPTAVIGACKKINGKTLFVGLPTADEYDSTIVVYVFNENNNRAYPFVKASVRPNAETINKQILSDIPEIIDTNIYNHTIFDQCKTGQETIGLTVYLSNILRINLKKYHMSEVVHAPWPEDFMKYIIKNNIEIM